ncbi:hypothetical protein ZEAMMB73_Zm00001d019338, partial [Zea mays]
MSSGRPRRRATTELQGKVRVKPVDELRRRWASGSNSTFSRDETASTEELDLDVDRIQDEVKLNWLTPDIALRVDADPLKDLRVKGSISRFWGYGDECNEDYLQESESVETPSKSLIVKKAYMAGYSFQDLVQADRYLDSSTISAQVSAIETPSDLGSKGKFVRNLLTDPVTNKKKTGKPWQGPLLAPRISPPLTLADCPFRVNRRFQRIGEQGSGNMVTISDQSWGRKSDAAQNLKLHARFQALVTEGSTSKKGNTKFRPNWALARLLTRRGKFFGKAQPTNVCPKGVIPYVPPLPRFAAAVNSPTLPVLPSHKPPYKSYAEVVRRGVKAMEDRGKTGFSGYGAGRALGHNRGDRMELRQGQVQGNNTGFGQGSGPFQPATMLGGNCQQIAPNFGGSFFGQGNLVFGQRLQVQNDNNNIQIQKNMGNDVEQIQPHMQATLRKNCLFTISETHAESQPAAIQTKQNQKEDDGGIEATASDALGPLLDRALTELKERQFPHNGSTEDGQVLTDNQLHTPPYQVKKNYNARTPKRRSKRREDSVNEDSIERAERLVAKRNLENSKGPLKKIRFKRPPVKTDQDNKTKLDESDEDIDLKPLSLLCGDLTEEIMDSQVEENIL